MGDLTKNFSKWEFRCNCGCGICNVNPFFLEKLQKVRSIVAIKFTIISGCRCPIYNENEGGTAESDHLTTEAIACEGADIFCDSSRNRYRIIEAAYDVQFKRIGPHKTFVHLGTAKRNPQNVLWLY